MANKKLSDLSALGATADDLDLVEIQDVSDLTDGASGTTKSATRGDIVPTAAETKTAYESNADTNEFSDAEQGGLAGLMAGTTAEKHDLIEKTTTYSAGSGDALILCDATGGAFTITLPTASGNSGRELWFKKIDASANAVTIDGNGAETIEGAANQVLSSQYDTLRLTCDATEWWIM